MIPSFFVAKLKDQIPFFDSYAWKQHQQILLEKCEWYITRCNIQAWEVRG